MGCRCVEIWKQTGGELLWLVKRAGKPRLRLVKKTGKKHKNLLKESKLLPRVAARGLVLLPLRLLPPSDPDSSPPTSPASSQGLHHPLVLLQVLGEDGPDVEEGEEDVDLLLLRQQLGGRLPCLELLCSHRQEPDEILEIMRYYYCWDYVVAHLASLKCHPLVLRSWHKVASSARSVAPSGN